MEDDAGFERTGGSSKLKGLGRGYQGGCGHGKEGVRWIGRTKCRGCHKTILFKKSLLTETGF